MTSSFVRLVATDRYRLAVRVLRPRSIEGDPCHLLADVSVLKDIGTWALGTPEVRIDLDRRGARIHSGDQVRTVPVTGETYPSYRTILDGLPAARTRVITDRIALEKALTGHPAGASITMRTTEHEVVLECDGPAGTALHAICTGPPLRIAFDPDVLLPALDSGVGPDVLLEISSATDPVVVRSADQGSFTSLVMPVHGPTAR